ncbi:MAG: SDR family oxidoreductase [Alistipes senegalensis]|nr:SDR family oxidoreductase [Alistipes senegalensis]
MKICLMCRQRNMEEYGICPDCLAINEKMRTLSCDLTGKNAVVTGGRIKIGYAVCLRLLRMGASVIAVTRYPKNALETYAKEPDFEEFRSRLFIIGFDLMRVDRLNELIYEIERIFNGHLDILINNAAQTVKKSTEYYAEIELKEKSIECSSGQLLSLKAPEQENFSIIPNNQLVDYSEQPDKNSWVRRPEEISPQELLEVQLINVTAPFILTNGLRKYLAHGKDNKSWVINVSSVEGRFNTKQKLARHVHTNMAKASLNMMTHSIASDFVRDGIYVYSCDPGWVSNQFPPAYEISINFRPYLTYDDGAMRILYPIIKNFNEIKIKDYGMFYKDYKIIDY